MPENKDQHYVPKMLMKRFADSKHIFSLIYKNSKNDYKAVEHVPYDSQCQYDYYYGRDIEWEKELKTIETDCSPVFDRICSSPNYYPIDEEIMLIKRFFLAQHSRTPRIIAWEKEQIKRMCIESYRLEKYKGKYGPISNSELEQFDKFDSSFEERAKDAMRGICFESKYISDLELIIVHFECQLQLVLSDDPVIILNPFNHSAGFINIGLLMLMPIDGKTLLVLRDPVLFEKTDRIVFSKRAKAVNCLNAFQAITFDQRLMFSMPTSIEYVFDLIEKTKVERRKFDRTGSGGVFYGLNDCMVVTHHPTQIPNYPYVFSSIKREFRKFTFYDHISYRFYSGLYLKRLTESFPVFGQLEKVNIDLDKLPHYIKFTKKYWVIHKEFETIQIDIDGEKKELDEYSGLPKGIFTVGN